MWSFHFTWITSLTSFKSIYSTKYVSVFSLNMFFFFTTLGAFKTCIQHRWAVCSQHEIFLEWSPCWVHFSVFTELVLFQCHHCRDCVSAWRMLTTFKCVHFNNDASVCLSIYHCNLHHAACPCIDDLPGNIKFHKLCHMGNGAPLPSACY